MNWNLLLKQQSLLVEMELEKQVFFRLLKLD